MLTKNLTENLFYDICYNNVLETYSERYKRIKKDV